VIGGTDRFRASNPRVIGGTDQIDWFRTPGTPIGVKSIGGTDQQSLRTVKSIGGTDHARVGGCA
jgi:hypothetical protein